MKDVNKFESNDKKARWRTKTIQIALILPFIGVLFYLTPFIDNFTGVIPSSDEGAVNYSISRSALYIFVTWAVLIVCAMVLAFRIGSTDEVE
jgi:polyferredoxin